MQVAIPFAMFFVGEMLETPFAYFNEALLEDVLGSESIGKQQSDHGFAMRPPELHIVPVLLDRTMLEIAEVK